jgi:hypothetical protein
MGTTGIITAADLEHLRRVHDGIIVADAESHPIVRSKIRYDGPDPLYDGVDQIVVLDGDPVSFSLYDTDAEIAEDLSGRWTNLVSDAWERYEQDSYMRERF